MDIGKSCPGFFMAVGNHIPSNTPVDNALWYSEFYEQMAGRQREKRPGRQRLMRPTDKKQGAAAK